MGEPLVPGRFAAGANVTYDEDVLVEKMNLILNAGAYATSAATTLHVATTGNDTTGDGSALAPYATLNKAYSVLPKFIWHACTILVDAGVYATGLPEAFNSIFFDGGSLAVIGVGTPVVEAAALAVTGVAALNAQVQRVTIGAGGVGADDSRCGQFLMITAGGAGVDYVLPIVANTDTTIDVVVIAQSVTNGDTINLVSPAVKIAADKCSIHVQDKGGSAMLPSFDVQNSKLCFHNIHLDFSASTRVLDLMRIQGGIGYGGLVMDFVRIDVPAGVLQGIILDNCTLGSGCYFVDSTYIVSGGTGLKNGLGNDKVGLSITGAASRDSISVYCYGRNALGNITIKDGFGCEHSNVLLTNIAVGTCILLNSTVELSSGIVVGKVGGAAITAQSSKVTINAINFQLGTYAIEVGQLSNADISQCTCDAVGITQGALSVSAGCNVRMKGAHTGFLGATVARAAYVFVAPAADVLGAAWPANGAGETDSMGSWIVRLD